LIRFGI
ncbi:hypothetical protein Tsp_10619, partial [Trichinella spiralis]